jgi:HAMP domain-containing protein
MKIRQKLLLSYLLIVALFIAAGVTVALNTTKMADLQNNVKTQIQINNNAYVYQQALDMKQFGTLVYCTENQTLGTQIIVASADTMQPAQDNLTEELANNPTLLAQFNEVMAIDNTTINGAITQATQITNSNTMNDTSKFIQTWNQLNILTNGLAQADTALQTVRSATMANVQDAAVQSQNYANFSNIINITFIVVISAVSVALAFIMGKRITDPLKKLADIAHKVSLGDLNQRYYLSQKIDIKTGDEIDELVDAFKRMINAFRMIEALNKETEDQP